LNLPIEAQGPDEDSPLTLGQLQAFSQAIRATLASFGDLVEAHADQTTATLDQIPVEEISHHVQSLNRRVSNFADALDSLEQQVQQGAAPRAKPTADIWDAMFQRFMCVGLTILTAILILTFALVILVYFLQRAIDAQHSRGTG